MCGLFNRYQSQLANVFVQTCGQAGQQGHIVLRPQHQRGHLDAQRLGRDLHGAGTRVGGGGRAQGRCAVVVEAALQSVLPNLAVLRLNSGGEPVRRGVCRWRGERLQRAVLACQKAEQALEIVGR